ncbi:MAG: hypothetical protein ACYDHP_06790 [Ferrimicrobium sp.]
MSPYPLDNAARKSRTKSVICSIRLTPEQTNEIQRAADVPAAALVRDWVLQGLANERKVSDVDAVMDAWPKTSVNSNATLSKGKHPPLDSLSSEYLRRGKD